MKTPTMYIRYESNEAVDSMDKVAREKQNIYSGIVNDQDV